MDNFARQVYRRVLKNMDDAAKPKPNPTIRQQQKISARLEKQFPSIARIAKAPVTVQAPTPKGYAKSSLDLMERFPGLKNIKKAN